MGDLIRFPRRDTEPTSEATDGSTARITVDPVDDHSPAQDRPAEHDQPGAETNATGAVEKSPSRRGLVEQVKALQNRPEVRFAARHGYYVRAGAGMHLRQTWDHATHGDLRKEIRAARASGDRESVVALAGLLEQARKGRTERLTAQVTLTFQVLKKTLVAVIVALGVASVVGLINAVRGAHPSFVDIWSWVLDCFSAGVGGLTWAVNGWPWWLLLVALTWAVTAYATGRNRGTAPAWTRADGDAAADRAVVVTADGIVTALQNLQIPALRKAFKDGWLPRFDLTPTREGQGAFKGYRAIFETPMGVNAEKIADHRAVFARNLQRNDIEVWVGDHGKQRGGRAGYVNLYVADPGVMDKPTPEYPLMHSGTADVFTGVPVGITQRGEPVRFPLVGSNFEFGGTPGQGKSNAGRVVMAGAALDPLAELWVHVFAMNGDFDAYAPRLARYTKGATPEHAALATESLRELYEEVGRREGRLAELGAKKLTRGIAEKHSDMRPVIAYFSECHELFGDDDCGEEAAELATQVIKRGRKTGVVLGFDTQSARADAIPPQVVENVGINGCFYVKSWRSNDGFLGDGSFAAGIRATDLRFNVDRGTMVVTGVSEELFEILRTYFVAVDDDSGWDAASEIIERAVQHVAPGTRIDGQAAAEAPKPRDLLEDLDEVLGTEPVNAADVPALLRDSAPDWAPYRAMNGKTLREELAKLGIKVPTTGHKYPVDPATVRSTLARRPTADLDDQG